MALCVWVVLKIVIILQPRLPGHTVPAMGSYATGILNTANKPAIV